MEKWSSIPAAEPGAEGGVKPLGCEGWAACGGYGCTGALIPGYGGGACIMYTLSSETGGDINIHIDVGSTAIPSILMAI